MEENQISLQRCMTEVVLPSCFLQVNPDVINKGGVSIPLLFSKPGAGKTSILKSMFKELNWAVLTIQPALKPQEEYGGIPKFKYTTLEEGQEKILGTVWSIPQVSVDLHKLAKQYDGVTFFWDDIHLCGPEHLPIMQECFTERTIRGYDLPSNCALVLAGNPSSKAGYRSLSSAIMNRCVRLPVYTNFDEWKKEFAVGNGFHKGLLSFLGHTMYSKYFHEDELVDEAWGSPRQWTKLSNYMTEYETQTGSKIESDILLYVTTGHCGAEAASQFVKYYEIYSKFDIKNIFQNIDQFEIPFNEVDRYIFIFAALNYVTANYNRSTKADLNTKIVKICEKYLEVDRSLCIILLKELQLIDSKQLKAKIDFTSENNGILTQLEEKYKDQYTNIIHALVDESNE